MYPVYRQVYIDKEVADELLSDYILSERSKSEPYSDSENAANFTAFAIFSTEEKKNLWCLHYGIFGGVFLCTDSVYDYLFV